MANNRRDPAALCAYLTEHAGAGAAVVSLNLACTAIRHVHRMHDLPDPVASPTVVQVRLGLRGTYGTAPRRQAHPLTIAEIQQIVTTIDRTTPRGIRDAAIIHLGYASATRRAELVALTLLDLRQEPAGLLLTSSTPRPTRTTTATSPPSPVATTAAWTPSLPPPHGAASAATHPAQCCADLLEQTMNKMSPRLLSQSAGEGGRPWSSTAT